MSTCCGFDEPLNHERRSCVRSRWNEVRVHAKSSALDYNDGDVGSHALLPNKASHFDLPNTLDIENLWDVSTLGRLKMLGKGVRMRKL